MVEDCQVSFGEITDLFGMPVSTLVGWLTNPSKEMKNLNRALRKQIDRDHIYASPADAQLIKVIDRLDNLNDIQLAQDSFKLLYAKESLQLATVLTKAPASLVEELRCLAESLLQNPFTVTVS